MQLKLLLPDDYKKLTGESLAQTVDLKHWKKSYEALTDYRRFEAEVVAAETSSSAFRKVVRAEIFPEIPKAHNAPAHAGVYKMEFAEVERTQCNSLMNGLVKACDGNVHVFNALTMQIFQIAVVAASYKAEEETWAHRIFKHDIRIEPGADVIKESLRLLKSSVPGQDGAKKTKKLSEMMRRGTSRLK